MEQINICPSCKGIQIYHLYNEEGNIIYIKCKTCLFKQGKKPLTVCGLGFRTTLASALRLENYKSPRKRKYYKVLKPIY